ncbi:dynein beta chain, ciliary [Nilaparvata lugens]|uniref:dynein beta chain, ciliary n=1 Tax=Nilaparvata lugens TaxID=108931 RepID=UPI00193D1465|nr:dynein beta chain, ciliary [Nilaparvata lugens]
MAEIGDEDAVESDPRLLFIYNYLSKTVKFKVDKWQKMMGNEEFKSIIMDFFSKTFINMLVVRLTPAGVLMPSHTFPPGSKVKMSYFVRCREEVITPENFKELIVYGDVAPKPIDELAVLVEEVMMPLLTNPSNHTNWPQVVVHDVKKHVTDLKNIVYKVRGEINGQTLLPLPDGIDKVYEVESRIIESNGEDVDLKLKSALEGAVIKWATQVNNIIKQTSNQVFQAERHPVPQAEFDFWKSRAINLESVYEQLSDPRVKTMASILQLSDSAYLPCFKTIFRNVVAGVHEAREIDKFLKPLQKQIIAIENAEFNEIAPLLSPMLHVLCLTWVHCKYYCSSTKVITVLKEICNLLILQANKYLDPESIFQGEVDETIPRLKSVINILNDFKQLFESARVHLLSLFPPEATVVPWEFHSNLVFDHLNTYLKRLDVIDEFFKIVVEYSKLEKVEIGGLNGRSLGTKVAQIFDEFSMAFSVLQAVHYNPADPEDPSFIEDYDRFVGKILDLDRRMAAIASLAFDECHNLEQIFKMLYVMGSILERPIISVEVSPKYPRIIRLLNEEVDSVKNLFDSQASVLRESSKMMVGAHWPPVSGSLVWISNLRARITNPVETFKAFDNPISHTAEAERVLEKFENMISLLDDLEMELIDRWVSRVPEECQQNLNKSLITINTDKMLNLNFDPKLAAALKEVRYLSLIGKGDYIPEAANDLFSRSDELFEYTFNLNLMIKAYNRMRKRSRPQEFALVSSEIAEIDELLEEAQSTLNWNSEGDWDYIVKIRDLVEKLAKRVDHSQDNLEKIIKLINSWNFLPLHNRSHGTQDSLLDLEGGPERVVKRYNEISNAAVSITKLVKENFYLYHNIPLPEPPEPPKKSVSEDEEEALVFEEVAAELALEEADDGGGSDDEGSEAAARKSQKAKPDAEATVKLEAAEGHDEEEAAETSDISRFSKSASVDQSRVSRASMKKSIEPETATRASRASMKQSVEQEEADVKEEKEAEPVSKPSVSKKAAPQKGSPRKSRVKSGKGAKKGKKEVEPEPEEPEPESPVEPQLTFSQEKFLQVEEDEELRDRWYNYLDMVDEIMLEGLLHCVGCSLGLINDNMNPAKVPSPLFSVRLELVEPEIVFIPPLDFDSEDPQSFVNIVTNVMHEINFQASLVPRISKRHAEGDYLNNVVNHEDISDMKNETIMRVNLAINEAIKYCSAFEQYSYLWLDDRDLFLKQFLTYGHPLTPEECDMEGKLDDEGLPLLKECPPKLEAFKTQIDIYEQLYTEVDKIEMQKVFFYWFVIDIRPFKQALLNTVCKWSMMFKQHLINHVVNSLNELAKFVEEADVGLMKPLTEGDYDGLVTVMGYLMQVKERQMTTDYMFEPLRDIIELVKTYDLEFPEETYVLLQDLPDRWNNTKKTAIAVKAAVMPLMQAEANTVRKRLVLFDIRQGLFRDSFRRSPFFRWECEDVYKEIDKTHFEMMELEQLTEKLTQQATLFEVIVPEFKLVKQLRKELKMVKILWDYILVVRSWISDWEGTQWKRIDSETMDMELKKFSKEIRTLDKEMRGWDIYVQLESVIKNMITALRAVTELQNPAIRERHWKQLMAATKVKFVIGESTTLAELLALNLYKYEEEVKTIVDKSVKEMSMEKTLNEMNQTWSTMEFEYEPHPRTGCKVLRVSEELIEILEDNQVQLQNMMSSKFIAYFLEEVSDWQKKLSNADQVIHIWIEVQRTWMHLESIFIGSEDIRRQLPDDSKRFDYIDKEFRVLLDDIAKTPNVIKATNKPKLFEKLELLQSELIKCEKALAEYLETKRLAYPRFYFVSSADLLDILSNGNQPELVCRHLTKLYDSIAKLKFQQENNKNTKIAKGMFAKDGEYVEFSIDCDCSGQVEKWLNNVTDAMRISGRHYFSEAVVTYDEKPREQWLFDYPAQCALCGTQIWWTTEVNLAFARLEEGYENALKDYQKKQILQLSTLITLLLGELTAGDRQKIMTICTIDVHSRDVVSKLIMMKVENSSAFQWQSQLRHRWDTDIKDCFANICDAQFRYDYEYLGNTPRLVITPLTDRCYITLTQSLHLVMGGAPAGPAGTGKTETTKDLGKAIGIMVYVFNCSEQMDYKSCGNIYKGLAQTGAWGCFDEFNRISVEVLSVVAVQVKTVLDAIKAKKTQFMFLGELIQLVPTVGMFITMNPGYAGRAELPENLKALFRPCAMVVPDFELICEIMLVAEGFQEARLLARKFITLYSLCRELLSKQDHYDWGLRAIKSVLVVAGSLKRGDKQRPEDQVLMRALRDFNIPKIVTDDMSIFMGLIGDLFPALDVPRKRDLDFEKQVKQAAVDLHLQPEENFILKVVQLQELFAVRHSVFIVGNAGTGKSMVWKTLYRTYQNQKRKPVYFDLEPKAVTNDELFGIINPSTREWKDGLFSVLIREQANMAGDGPKWMVLDGDIDPMWIESLNTVMDDNKVLTLASNERIALTPSMRLLFEISNLRTATPATVSRAGILYINPQDLGWNPYVASWIDSQDESKKAILMVLFDKYIPPCLEASRTKFKKITPIPEIAHIQMLCTLLESLLIPSNVPNDCPKEWYEIYFVFACVWAFGSCTFQDQLVDWRNEFTKWWTNEFKTVKFPGTGHVFNYFIDNDTKRFVPWSERVQKFDLDHDIPLQSAVVNTTETTRVRYFLDLLLEKKKPVMLVGAAGSGKSVLTAEKLNSLSDNYAVTNVPFNFYTTSEMLQKVLEKPLEKKAGRNYGPSGNKTMIYFLDDMNMPEVDKYGTVQPHTLIRQHMDYQHWYDRVKLSLKEIHNVVFFSAMNPTAGSFTIDSRLQRHFSVFALSFPSQEALNHIYTSIITQHFNLHNKFPSLVVRSCDLIVQLALGMQAKVAQVFLPTAVRFHYIWNLRDLTNIFQGMLFASNECVKTPGNFVRLWMHEATRVYCDKLIDTRDQEIFRKMTLDNIKKVFAEMPESEYNEKPLIYCHFVEGIGDPKYLPMPNWVALNKLVTEAMAQYNDLVAGMNLVLFEDAMSHICRINRIMESPRGNGLLIGVGGSGKQSLARLSAFISSLEPFQIQLKKGYSVSDLKGDLSSLYIKAGLKNVGIMFLMTDSQVPDEKFLVLINDMLASGEIPELFPDEEVDNIVAAISTEVKGAGIPDTRENCWKYFIDRVRRLIKVMLCFSPVGSTLRVRGRKFPALVNCTAINWFMEWPQEALESVSGRFLSEIDVLPSNLRKVASQFMAYVHNSVNQMSGLYLLNERRFNYTTPKSFLELISLYGKLLKKTIVDVIAKTNRLQVGLKRLVGTSEQVGGLKKQLAEQEKIIAEKTAAATMLIKIVAKEQDKVTKEKIFVAEEERKVRIMEEDIIVKQKVCEEDLVAAEPALVAAMEALNTLNKNNLTELKSFGSPPEPVVKVTEAVLVLFAPKGKVPRDRSWKACKVMMAKVDSFLDNLLHYDKENIHPDIIKELERHYLNSPDFDPEIVISKSSAAAGLCSWVINIHKFHLVWCVVLPKRKALAQANKELAEARAKLAELKVKLEELEAELAILTKRFEDAVADKLQCQTEAEKTAETIDLANRLVTGLASENQRWKETVNNLMKQQQTLPGDMLIVTAFISYVGCFTRKYRNDLMLKYWLPFIQKLKPSIPLTHELDVLLLLTDDAQVAEWNNLGLPSDRMSTENATILVNSERWPLIIDPQLQGVKWIKMMYAEKLKVIRLGHKNYLDRIEKAVSDGATLLIENIGESIDPVLDNLLGRNLIKRGKIVKIGDKEVDFNMNFRLILHTKLANPHYKPEMQAQTTLINFTVTKDGLEEQLLAEVVKAERPDLETLKADLTTQQNTFKITLKQLEDDLLMRLASAGPDILNDKELVLRLEQTKKTADEIEHKVTETKDTGVKIDLAREMYRPAARRASILYFILNDLHKINPIYQFSLKAFSVVFQQAIAKAEQALELSVRVDNLIDCITFSVFMYTSRGLFESDKLIFLAQMTIQILLSSGEIKEEELDFLLRFPYVANLTSPVSFLTNQLWGGIKALVLMDAFKSLDKDIEGSANRWKKFIEGESPEREKFPQEWKNKSALQRLCMMRSMRPDRMTYAVRCFIEEKLGTKFTEARTVEFSKSYKEMSSTVPMFFILSPGVDPTRDVEAVGKKLGFTADRRNLHNISLGQGQELIAESTMDLASRIGHWVILQNIHLVSKWLPSLEKKMEACAERPHSEYRLFISAEPAPTPDMHIIPQGVLESSIKITNEPPSGMLANLHKALDNFNQDTLEMCSKEAEFKAILFSLCYFHAVVAERRKFGAQGWNRTYPFNVGDLTISVHVLFNYLENNTKVPWEDLRYLFGEIMYGGHITDDWDRRLCRTYLQEYMCPELVDGDLHYAPGFPAPPNSDYVGYHSYIDDVLPPESPVLYGLHPNAEIGVLTMLSEKLFRTIFELQPRDSGSGGGGGVSREEKVRQILDDILDKIPDGFNISEMMARVEEKTPYTVVAFQECERMNILMKEIRRSLKELSLGLKGELTITLDMEELETSLFLDQVPENWMKRAYPSLLGLSAWFADLMVRLKELEQWVGDFTLPSTVWLAGFFNPQSFLTAIMQSTARRNEWPLDKMCLQCDVTRKQKEDFTAPPREGAYINGLFVEGARWDMQTGVLADSMLKELFPTLPVLFIRAVTQDKQETRNIYECPVYKTRQRGPTYVWTFNLKTKEKPSKWTMAGVGILLSI